MRCFTDFTSSLHGGHADLPCVVSVLVHVLMKRAAHLDFLSKEKVSKETLSLVFILCYLLETSRGQNSAVFKIKTCVCVSAHARARVCKYLLVLMASFKLEHCM